MIAGDKEGSHFVGLQKIWQRVRAAAKLADVRIHDLRHNFASHGAALGESLFVLVGRLAIAIKQPRSAMRTLPMIQCAALLSESRTLFPQRCLAGLTFTTGVAECEGDIKGPSVELAEAILVGIAALNEPEFGLPDPKVALSRSGLKKAILRAQRLRKALAEEPKKPLGVF